jgi:hypothetical protein
MTSRTLAALTCLAALPALANLNVHNTLAENVRVEVTEPNGKVSQRKLGPASPAASSAHFIFAMGVKQVPVAIFDDMGEALWKDTVAVDDVLVLVKGGKGVEVLRAGKYGGSGGPYAAAFVNASGEPLTIDLVGDNGLAAHRDITPGSSFDLKKAVKLDTRESSYKVTGKLASGEAVDLASSRVMPSRYYVIYKNATGQVRVLMAGNMTAPK